MKLKILFGLIVAGLMGSSAFAIGRNQVGVNAGFNRGGFTLGGDYEYLMKRQYGFGGFARFFQKDSGQGANGLFIFGGNARLHQVIEEFDFSVAPGMAIVSIDPAGNGESKVSVGPSFSLAVTYQLNDRVALGLENSRYYVWFDENYRGIVMDDTSFRFVANF